MFDTVRAYVIVDIALDKFEALKAKYKVDIKRQVHDDTGEVTFSSYIKQHRIPFISYHSSSQILTIEVSIPNYLYGNNVQMVIHEDEIKQFWINLKQDINLLLGTNIEADEWQRKRIDCCYNLNISTTGFHIEEWLTFISQESIPYKKNKAIHHNEMTRKKTGVTFKANAKSPDKVMFYSKYDEVSNSKKAYSKEIIQLAKDILRVEVRTSKYEQDGFNKSKRLVDFLNVQFFEYIMEKYKVNAMLRKKTQQDNGKEQLPYQWLLQHFTIAQIETAVGHMDIKNQLNESAKSLYKKSTWDNREKLLQEFNLRLQEYKDIPRHHIAIDFKLLGQPQKTVS